MSVHVPRWFTGTATPSAMYVVIEQELDFGVQRTALNISGGNATWANYDPAAEATTQRIALAQGAGADSFWMTKIIQEIVPDGGPVFAKYFDGTPAAGGTARGEYRGYVRGNRWSLHDSTIFHAAVLVAVDDANSRDRYRVFWYEDDEKIPAASISSPTIQVIEADGSDLIAQTAMSAIAGTDGFLYSETTNRLGDGDPVEVVVRATIDGIARSWTLLQARDST